MKINLLSEQTILQIAAGEVVERPASVVKELLDNCIDAQAQTVRIEIGDGGLKSIKISDDGEGMAPEDLALAVERHSTSKIVDSDDLFNITTLGFRGEALASIGAVSVMTITTGRRRDTAGSTLTVTGGEQGRVAPAANPGGTIIEVKDLFYNTPPRRKFLRQGATEFAQLAAVVQQTALAWPAIRFQLFHNSRAVLSTPGTGSLIDAIAAIAGLEIAENLLECSLNIDGMSLHGYIARPEFHRANRSWQYFTVNGRPVSLYLAANAVERAFHTLLPVKRYPLAFLNILVPREQVDVNVHPTKREVKFNDASAVYKLVHRACAGALQVLTDIPYAPPADQVPYRPSGLAKPGFEAPFKPLPRHYRQTAPAGQQAVQETLWGGRTSAGGRPDEYTILGQVFATFLVVATANELRLVDQHAAQERVLYEKYLGLLQTGAKAGQVILPLAMPLAGRSRQFVETWLPQLAELGFRIELTDGGMVLKEAPILFKKTLSEADVLELVEVLAEHDGRFSLGDYQQAALMLLACKGAIKANQRLSLNESQQLLIDLDACENSRTCPHGRPIWVAFNRVNLEKLFARR